LQAGDRLKHYEVIEKIGQGGMGEVFRARDTKLGRDVALKVLPPEFATDQDRLARFRREAKVLAQLHHPNIASIFDLEETPRAVFLVMELVEGDDLSVVLRQGALPVEDAIAVAKQIAEGLEEAHENGIVHRDLKPANVKRTPDGKVKILDFGLAMALAGHSSAEEESISGMATLTAAGVTQAGMVLGTAAYMSPEQARGLAVDRRTDIWAFGVILFEMLTGSRLFEGATVTDTLASILKTDPEWDALPEGLPRQVERVLRRCLTRNPRQRLRDIGEARVRLEEPEAESGFFTGPVAALGADEPSPLRWLPWGLFVLAVAALGYFVVRGRGDDGSAGPLQLSVPAPNEVQFQLDTSFPAMPSISPDGRYAVFGGRTQDGTPRLYLRAFDSSQAVALDGTENAQYPFWSPDSRFIAFFDRNEGLKKIPVNGGPDQTICPAQNAKGGSWSPAGVIVFSPNHDAPIVKVPAVGGDPVPVTDLESDAGFDSHRHPWFLPDGRRFLYLARAQAGGDSEIRVASIDGDSSRVVTRNASQVEFADGNLLYERNQVLLAQPFDPESLAFLGDPVPVASNLLVIGGAARALFSVSQTGRLVYMRGQELNQDSSLAWRDREGRTLEELAEKDAFDTAVLSPDERFIALTVLDPTATHRDIWIYEIERKFRERFTTAPTSETYPLWSPDGRYLYYAANPDGTFNLYRKAVSGNRPAELVLDLGTDILPWDISPDGSRLLYSINGQGTETDLYVTDLAGGSEPRLLVQSDNDDAAARFAPNGKWISYWSMETGSGQIYLASWPDMDWVRRVSTTTGAWQFWLDDGRTLVFQDGTGQVYEVTITEEDGGVRISAPTLLFDHGAMQFAGPLIDVTGDGQKFITVQTAAANPPNYFDVVLDWPALLPRP